MKRGDAFPPREHNKRVTRSEKATAVKTKKTLSNICDNDTGIAGGNSNKQTYTLVFENDFDKRQHIPVCDIFMWLNAIEWIEALKRQRKVFERMFSRHRIACDKKWSKQDYVQKLIAYIQDKKPSPRVVENIEEFMRTEAPSAFLAHPGVLKDVLNEEPCAESIGEELKTLRIENERLKAEIAAKNTERTDSLTTMTQDQYIMTRTQLLQIIKFVSQFHLLCLCDASMEFEESRLHGYYPKMF